MIGAQLEGDADSGAKGPSEFFNRTDLGRLSQVLEGIASMWVITNSPAAVKIHVVVNTGKKTNPDFFCL